MLLDENQFLSGFFFFVINKEVGDVDQQVDQEDDVGVFMQLVEDCNFVLGNYEWQWVVGSVLQLDLQNVGGGQEQCDEGYCDGY